MVNNYASPDGTCSSNLRQVLELSKQKNREWKNDLLENQNRMDKKMRRQTIIHDLMVANNNRMTEKCKSYEEQLERIKLDKVCFKRTMKRLLVEADKVAGGPVDKNSENGDKDFEDDDKLKVGHI